MLLHSFYCQIVCIWLFRCNIYMHSIHQHFIHTLQQCNSSLKTTPLIFLSPLRYPLSAKYNKFYLPPHPVFMYRNVLRTATVYFHKQHCTLCLLAVLYGRQKLECYHQINVIHAEILLRYFLRFLL
jgi:hypothetical protein